MSCDINKPVKRADFNVFKVDKYWWKKLFTWVKTEKETLLQQEVQSHSQQISAEVHSFPKVTNNVCYRCHISFIKNKMTNPYNVLDCAFLDLQGCVSRNHSDSVLPKWVDYNRQTLTLKESLCLFLKAGWPVAWLLLTDVCKPYTVITQVS